MIEVPLYIFLFLFIIFFAISVGLYIVILSHVVHSASLTVTSFFVSFCIFAAGAVVLYATIFLLQGVDWTQILFQADLGRLNRF